MNFEFTIKILVVLILVFFFVLRSRFTKHYKKFTPKTLIKYIIALVLMLLYFGKFLDFATFSFSYTFRLAMGLPVIIIGLILFFWSHIHLSHNWSPVIEKKFAKSRTLITTGPYQLIRHPIYTASFIVLAGFFILTANWLLAGIPLIILTIFYSIKIPREEDELIRNFGKSYTKYMTTTGSLVPKIF